MRLSSSTILSLLASLSVAQAQLQKYFVDCGDIGNKCPDDVIAAIGNAGGTNIESHDEGWATFDCETLIEVDGVTIFPNFELFSVVDVGTSDGSVSFEVTEADLPEERRRLREEKGHRQAQEGASYPPFAFDDDRFMDLQWHHEAVGSVAAWEQGFTGQDVRVAVLDSGIDLNHRDLAPNLNVSLSRSFTNEPLQTTDTFSHASHVAGIIGAADNGFGTVGVAPDVELVAVKVLRDYGRGGYFSWIVAGIYYAVAAEADIINMSLGAMIARTQGQYNNNAGVTNLRNYVCKAVRYAKQQGVTVIVSAGNDAVDLQSPGMSHIVRFMGDCQDALVITAATPLGWAIPPYTADLYEQASYSTYGEADFAGSGGSVDLRPTDPSSVCNVRGIVRYCWVFDLVFSTSGTGTWYWSAGTSMASPAAAGVAALIMSEEFANTGTKPDVGQLKTEMMRRALKRLGDDSRGNGRDDFFGMGHVHSGYYLL